MVYAECSVGHRNGLAGGGTSVQWQGSHHMCMLSARLRNEGWKFQTIGVWHAHQEAVTNLMGGGAKGETLAQISLKQSMEPQCADGRQHQQDSDWGQKDIACCKLATSFHLSYVVIQAVLDLLKSGLQS